MRKSDMLDRVYKSDLPSRAKQIMFYLINRVNIEGTCFPSIKTIASDCGISERTVQRTTKILLEKGFIKKDSRFREKGGQTSNLYSVVLEGKDDDEIKQTKYQEDVAEQSNDGEYVGNVGFEYYNGSQLTNKEDLKENKWIDFLIFITNHLSATIL